MTDYGKNLFDLLTDLVDNKKIDGLYAKDIDHTDGGRYRLFCYHYIDTSIVKDINNVVGYPFFDYRGVLFEIDPDGNYIRLASLPFEKFFNYKENEYTSDIDFSNTIEVAEKIDGSLISTFINKEGNVDVKTKAALESVQARDVRQLLNEFDSVRREVYDLEKQGYTVLFEYVSPRNRIVVPYENDDLVVLAVRDRRTGTYLSKEDLKEYKELYRRLTKVVDTDNVEHFVSQIPSFEGIEGYVVSVATSEKNLPLRVKIKTQWYIERHHIRDQITNPRTLILAIINQTVDDIRSVFFDSPSDLELIDKVERRVRSGYREIHATVEDFYNKHKNCSRKDYAIAGQRDSRGQLVFPLLMQRYQTTDINYQKFLEKVFSQRSIETAEKYINNELSIWDVLKEKK